MSTQSCQKKCQPAAVKKSICLPGLILKAEFTPFASDIRLCETAFSYDFF